MTNYPTLDRNRDYGEVHGDTAYGEKFAQDGFLFNWDGKLVTELLTDADKERLERVMERNAAMDAAKAAFMKIAPNTKPEDLDRIISPEALERGNDEEIDLVAWARGEKLYNFGKVTKVFRDRWSQSPVNKQQALEILAEHGLIPAFGGTPTIPSQQ